MVPEARYPGPEVAADDLVWQDPLPTADHAVIGDTGTARLKQAALATGLSVPTLAFTAFSSAVTHRDTDERGGANGARSALVPQKDWAVNRRTAAVIAALRGVVDDVNRLGAEQVSLADLIVLGGCVAVDQAAAAAGEQVAVPFTPGRVDATDAQTDVPTFRWLRPVVDGFRSYQMDGYAKVSSLAPERLFLDEAALLELTAPEWVALTGGLRVLGCNHDSADTGVVTDRVGTLSTDFFATLTSTDYDWHKQDEAGTEFTVDDRETGATVSRASCATSSRSGTS